MTVKNVLKKKKNSFAGMVLSAKDARALIKSEQLPENWLTVALIRIDEQIKFQAESKSNHTTIWNCQVQYADEYGRNVFVPIKDKAKLIEISNILISRGYEINVFQGYTGGEWSMDIKW